MVDRVAQQVIGRQLRRAYEEIPKGGIPDRLWLLLLAIERKGARSESPAGSASADLKTVLCDGRRLATS